jgi:ribosome-associated toxin RatA of RatAB toxin-antitoxin module
VAGQDFAQYPQISEYIRSVQWQPDRGHLEMKTEAYGYRATLEMQVASGRNEGREEIRFRVIDGVFRGMTGLVSFQDMSPKQSEISLTAAYDFVKLPMPKFFLEFGLEVALQRMAGALRNHVENLAQARSRIPKRQGKEIAP